MKSGAGKEPLWCLLVSSAPSNAVYLLRTSATATVPYFERIPISIGQSDSVLKEACMGIWKLHEGRDEPRVNVNRPSPE